MPISDILSGTGEWPYSVGPSNGGGGGFFGRVSDWLGDPQNRLALMQAGASIAGPDTFADRVNKNMGPSIQGQVFKQKAEEEKKKASKIFDDYHAGLLKNPDVGGITYKEDGKGGMTATLTATSQKDMATARAMDAQAAAGIQAPMSSLPAGQPEVYEQPAPGVDQPGTPLKASQMLGAGGGGSAQSPFGGAANSGQPQAWDVAWTPQIESGFQKWLSDGLAAKGIDPNTVTPEAADEYRKAFLQQYMGLTGQTAQRPAAAPRTVAAQPSPMPTAPPKQPPPKLSDFLGGPSYAGYGLTPEQMMAAYKFGTEEAMRPVTMAKAQAELEHTRATTDATQVATQEKRLGLLGKRTTRIDGSVVGMPGVQLDLDSKELASVGVKLQELKIKEENVVRMEQQARTLGDLRAAQEQERMLKVQKERARQQLLAAGKDDDLFPGSKTLTFKDARTLEATGTLDDYIRAESAAAAQTNIRDRSLAHDIRADYSKMQTELQRDPQTPVYAKKSGKGVPAYVLGTVDEMMTKKYGPGWKAKAGLEDKTITGLSDPLGIRK